jgi:hypothetical protein
MVVTELARLAGTKGVDANTGYRRVQFEKCASSSPQCAVSVIQVRRFKHGCDSNWYDWLACARDQPQEPAQQKKFK